MIGWFLSGYDCIISDNGCIQSKKKLENIVFQKFTPKLVKSNKSKINLLRDSINNLGLIFIRQYLLIIAEVNIEKCGGFYLSILLKKKHSRILYGLWNA